MAPPKDPELIELSDDEAEDELNQAVRHLSSEGNLDGGGATASIVNVKPLNIQSLFNSNTNKNTSAPSAYRPQPQINSLASRPLPTNHGTNGKVLWSSTTHASSSTQRITTSYNQAMNSNSSGPNQQRIAVPYNNPLKSMVPRQQINNGHSAAGIRQPYNVVATQYSGMATNSLYTAQQEKRPRFDPSVSIGNLHVNQQHNQQQQYPRPVVERNVINQAQQVKYFQNSYVEAYDYRNNPPVTDDEFQGQFKCTYNGCDKRLRNNVVFMHHLWAHVVQLKPAEDDDPTNMQIVLAQAARRQDENVFVPKSDVNRLRTCPECLVVQPNPYRMQLHFHRVHRRDGYFDSKSLATCAVCEAVIALEKMPNHIMGHPPEELPYSCRKCKYKTSSRAALIEHFSSKHAGSNFVMCPFCLITFKVLATERRRSVLTMKPFVEHMMAHDAERHQTCNKCSLKHISEVPNRPTESFIMHYNQHNNPDQRWKQNWKVSRKGLAALKRPQSKPVCLADANEMCLECSRIISKEGAFSVMNGGGSSGRELRGGGIQQPRQHYTKELSKCAFCEYQTRCVYALEMHNMTSKCNPASAMRWPLGRPSTALRSEHILKCVTCGFETAEGNRMAQHMTGSNVCRESKVKLVDHKPAAIEEADGEEWQEIEVFGLRRLADADPEAELRRKREAEEAAANAALKLQNSQNNSVGKRKEVAKELASLVSHYRVCELGRNQIAIKHLTEADPGDVKLADAILKTKGVIARRKALKEDREFFAASTAK